MTVYAAQAPSLTVAPATELAQRAATHGGSDHGGRHTLDQVIWAEDWETGNLHGWNAIDLTAQPSTWHLDDWNAFGGTGTSWWVGDTTLVGGRPLNGYQSDWYMVLDSPPITLPTTTPALSFWHRYRVEAPYSTSWPAGYNGWDGVNLRISTNDGATWTVVPNANVLPHYDRTSMYSFGQQHHEGTNIPGWCDTLRSMYTWHLETATLTPWAGQTVKFRFAFASDPEYATPDEPAMFGWQLDNFRVYQTGATDTVFTDDCNAVGGWTHRSMRAAAAGNLYRIAQDNTSPAGPRILVCNQVSNSRYLPNMNNVCESPILRFDTLNFGTLICDLQFKNAIAAGNWPDGDAWGAEVSIDSGLTWCNVSNPTCDPNGDNYIYNEQVADWTSFNEFYTNTMDFSALIGHTLKFRFTFFSNQDASVDFGPSWDGITFDYTAAFPNDLTCYTLQVRYPNNVNRPFRMKAYLRNVGANTANGVNAFWRRGTGTWSAFGLPFDNFAPGASRTMDTVATVTSVGLYTFQARGLLTGDNNLNNDTSTVPNVQVYGATSPLELGYDNHYVPPTQYSYLPFIPTGSGLCVKFTPFSDNVARLFNLNAVKVQFTGDQPEDPMPIRVHVYRGNNDAPGEEIFNQQMNVALSETGPTVWKSFDVSTDPDTRGLARDFWVWLEVVSTDTARRYPAVIVDELKPWDDIHHYTYNGTDISPINWFPQIHAVIAEASAIDHVTPEVPDKWSMDQNYPNPFNPTTEIRFTVPRSETMTLKVYNLLGQEVATLIDGVAKVGVHTVSFDASNLSTGVYVYRLESESFSATYKMLLLK